MKTLKITLLTSLLVFAALACSLGGGGENAGTQPTSGAGSQVAPAATSDNGTTIPTEPGQASPGTQEAGEENGGASKSQVYLPGVQLREIALLTPASGAGAKPFFEWEPVEGADWYGLVVKTADGQPYWAWMGRQTSIYMGGTSEAPREDAAGPRLIEEMFWAVVAYSADGKVIAASLLQPVAP